MKTDRPTSLAPVGVEETLALVDLHTFALPPEPVSLETAGGRVLREALHAPEDQPAFDRSSVDGYAVRCDDRATSFRIVDDIRAGDWKPRTLQLGEAVRIATGGALPGEGLQVTMKEDALVAGGELTVRRRDDVRNIRFRGEDAQAGSVLVPARTRLSPGALALLASVGCARPVVTRLRACFTRSPAMKSCRPSRRPGLGRFATPTRRWCGLSSANGAWRRDSFACRKTKRWPPPPSGI